MLINSLNVGLLKFGIQMIDVRQFLRISLSGHLLFPPGQQLMSKINTYQLRSGTVPQVQGYRPESFGILTYPVGGRRLIGKSALRYTTPQNTLLKESWTRWSLVLYRTHLSKNSSDC